MKLTAALFLTAALCLCGSGAALAADETQIFGTERSAVRITPIYHATAMIQVGRDIIYIDPAKPAKIEGRTAADLILITDIHGDHMDAADVAALSKTGTLVIAPAAVAKSIPQARVLDNGKSTLWRDFKITAVPMYNISHNQPSGQPYHDKGRGNGYVLTYGNRNFYFAGDTEGVPEMRALKKIDVAFIPMNLPYTMTPAEAADAVKAFKPKLVIPYHYKGQDVEAFKKALDGSGVQVLLLNWYPE